MNIVSRTVARGSMVYVQAATSEPAGDTPGRTRQLLEKIEELLQAVGTRKSKLLTARVLLSDMDLFAAYDSVWNEWVDPQRRPLRVCKLADPGPTKTLIDITVTATKSCQLTLAVSGRPAPRLSVTESPDGPATAATAG